MINRRNMNAKLVAIAIAVLPQIVTGNTIDNAFKFCSVLDGTGLLSKPCKVSGWSQSIDVSIDTSSSEARRICTGITSWRPLR